MSSSKLFAALLAVSALAAVAQQQPARELALIPVADLKRTYLACDRAASRALLDFATAAGCSEISEELLRRGFGGNFDSLLAWWREEKTRGAGESRTSSIAR